MFESLPTYPDAGRYWDLVARHKINSFYTAPTAIRALMKFGDDPVKKHGAPRRGVGEQWDDE
eukprot:1245527-Prymnesium_polylepis.1